MKNMAKKEELTPKAMSLKIIDKMKYGGCSPMHQTFGLKSIANIYVLVLGTFVLLSILNIVLSPNLTVDSVMGEAIMVIAYVQVTAKYYLSSRQAKEIRQTTEMIFDEFWSTDNGLLNEDEQENIRFLHRFAIVSASIYSFCAYSAITLFASHALLKHTLIISIWIPNKDILMEYPYFQIMVFFQAFTLYTACYFSVLQVDTLFIYFICFLFLKNLSEVYAKIFLPTIFSNFFLITLTLYATQSEVSINGKMMNFFTFVCVLGQLFAYCCGGQIIQDQGSEIGETIYNQNWYEMRDINLRKAFIMIIMRTGKPLQLTVAGILVLDMRSLATVIRGCFSFIAFLANVR